MGDRAGAVTGAVTGAAIGLPVAGQQDFIVIGGIVGAVVGVVLSIIPSLLVGLVVTEVIRRRHPHPPSGKAVSRDIMVVFVLVVAALDLALALKVHADSEVGGTDAAVLPYALVANAALALMMWRATRSISQAWWEAGRS